jgi:hypothetical protein
VRHAVEHAATVGRRQPVLDKPYQHHGYQSVDA